MLGKPVRQRLRERTHHLVPALLQRQPHFLGRAQHGGMFIDVAAGRLISARLHVPVFLAEVAPGVLGENAQRLGQDGIVGLQHGIDAFHEFMVGVVHAGDAHRILFAPFEAVHQMISGMESALIAG